MSESQYPSADDKIKWLAASGKEHSQTYEISTRCDLGLCTTGQRNSREKECQALVKGSEPAKSLCIFILALKNDSAIQNLSSPS